MLPEENLATWSYFWEIVKDMKLLSLGVHLDVHPVKTEVMGKDNECVQQMMKVSGVKKAELRIETTGWGPNTRQPGLEEIVKKQWMSMEPEGSKEMHGK